MVTHHLDIHHTIKVLTHRWVAILVLVYMLLNIMVRVHLSFFSSYAPHHESEIKLRRITNHKAKCVNSCLFAWVFLHISIVRLMVLSIILYKPSS
jgi:hypothetical protein